MYHFNHPIRGLCAALSLACFAACAPLAVFQPGSPDREGPEKARPVAVDAGAPARLTVQVYSPGVGVLAKALVTSSRDGAPGPAGRTDAAGRLQIAEAPPGAYVIKVKRPGFVENIRPVILRADSRTLIEIPLARYESEAVDLSKNVRVRRSNIEIEIPAGSFVDGDGRAAGSGVVQFRALDVLGEDLNLMPGDFRGIERSDDDPNDASITEIESFGAASVTVVDDSGRKLQIAAGKYLTLRLPYQSAGESAANVAASVPAEIPLWSMDEERGLWVREGAARTIARGSGAWTEAKLPHLSWWNIDQPLKTKHSIWVQSFVNESGESLFLPTMSGRGLDYNGISRPYGYYGKGESRIPGECIDVKADSKVRLNFTFADESGFYEAQREIQSGAGGSSCRTDPGAGTVIKQIVLRKLPTTCIRGSLNLKGAQGRESLRLELNAFGYLMEEGDTLVEDSGPDRSSNGGNRRGGLLYVGDAPVNDDGTADFCVDNAPANRDVWLFAIGPTVQKNLESCDREPVASFRIPITGDSADIDAGAAKGPGQRPATCARPDTCFDAGKLRGRLSQTRCVQER